MRAIGLREALAVVAVTGAMSLPQPLVASTFEHEVDTTGVVGFIQLAYGDHTINSAFATGIEVDSYRFDGAAGDRMRVVVSTLTNGPDPVLVLRGPTGTILQTTSCSGSSGGFGTTCATNLDQTLTATGTHILNLSEGDADEIGSYSLHLERYPPANNWVGLAYNTPLLEQLGHVTDMDFLAFSGAAGTGVRLTARSNTNGLDPRVELWDPLGNLISDTFCNGASGGFATRCTVSVDLDLQATGIYKLGLSDVSWNESGGYSLGVSCLYGTCPSAAPVIPEPETYAMMLAGLALLGFAARHRKRR